MGRWYRSLLVPEFSIWLFSWGELCLLLFLSRWLLISAGNLTGKVAFNYSFSLKNACDWLSKSSGDFCVTRQIICPSVESKLLTGWSDVILGPIVAFLEIFISLIKVSLLIFCMQIQQSLCQRLSPVPCAHIVGPKLDIPPVIIVDRRHVSVVRMLLNDNSANALRQSKVQM